MPLVEFFKQLQFVQIWPQHLSLSLDLKTEMKNTRLPPTCQDMYQALEPLAEMRRMSSFAIAALIGHILRQLPPDQVFLNIGVWHGFSLFAGMLLSPATPCIGVDNFSEFDILESPPQRFFYPGFAQFQTGAHQQFYELDYQAYFQNQHQAAIGLYFYDGPHNYADQLQGLGLAHPYISTQGLILVDDTNFEAPRAATLDFLQIHPEYQLLADLPTSNNGHPTFWNGVMILQKTKLKKY